MTDISKLVDIGMGLVHENQGQARLLKPGEGREIREYLENLTQRKGGNMYCVVARDGKAIQRHNHPEDVVLFYPQPEGIPVVLEENGSEDHPGRETAIYPARGDTAFVPKGVWHSVPHTAAGVVRVSIALKLEE